MLHSPCRSSDAQASFGYTTELAREVHLSSSLNFDSGRDDSFGEFDYIFTVHLNLSLDSDSLSDHRLNLSFLTQQLE
jgi:hypothetical protein